MTINPGTPDWQTGVVSPQKVIGSFPSGPASGVVGIPSNAEVIWIVAEDKVNSNTVTSVIGSTTGTSYPVYPIPEGNGIELNSQYVAIISGVLDSQVTINWSGASGIAWNVVADGAGRFVVDLGLLAASATNGGTMPTTAVLVAGSDGTDLRTLEVNSNGRLIPLVPTLSTSAVQGDGGTQTLLSAPGTGSYYLFGVDLQNLAGGPTTANLSIGGTEICTLQSAANNVPDHAQLGGYATVAAVSFAAATGVYVTLRYAPGP